jgi:hypothetical protein
MSASSKPPPNWGSFSLSLIRRIQRPTHGESSYCCQHWLSEARESVIKIFEPANTMAIQSQHRHHMQTLQDSTYASAVVNAASSLRSAPAKARVSPSSCEMQGFDIPLNGPELVRTTANTVGLRSSWLNAPVSSSIIPCDSAFLFLGLFNSNTAIPVSLMETTRLDGSKVWRLIVLSLGHWPGLPRLCVKAVVVFLCALWRF